MNPVILLDEIDKLVSWSFFGLRQESSSFLPVSLGRLSLGTRLSMPSPILRKILHTGQWVGVRRSTSNLRPSFEFRDLYSWNYAIHLRGYAAVYSSAPGE